MNPTDDRLAPALDAWSVPALSPAFSARTLTRARAALGPYESDRAQSQSRASRVGRFFVPVVLAMAASGVVVDTCWKIQRIFGS
jgi:hypothetical protein